jgi:hypothetical protein
MVHGCSARALRLLVATRLSGPLRRRVSAPEFLEALGYDRLGLGVGIIEPFAVAQRGLGLAILTCRLASGAAAQIHVDSVEVTISFGAELVPEPLRKDQDLGASNAPLRLVTVAFSIWEMNGTAALNANSSFVANVPAQWSAIQQLGAE